MIVSFVGKGLKQAGFVVEHVRNGETGRQLDRAASCDTAVIDIMSPVVCYLPASAPPPAPSTARSAAQRAPPRGATRPR